MRCRARPAESQVSTLTPSIRNCSASGSACRSTGSSSTTRTSFVETRSGASTIMSAPAVSGSRRWHPLRVGGTEIELHGDLPQPQLLADQRQRPQHDLVDGHILVADRGEAAEGTQVRDDLRGLVYLLHCRVEIGQHVPLVLPAQLDEVDNIAQE